MVLSYVYKIINTRFDKDDPDSIINDVQKWCGYCEQCHGWFLYNTYKLDVGKGDLNFTAYLCKHCIYLRLDTRKIIIEIIDNVIHSAVEIPKLIYEYV